MVGMNGITSQAAPGVYALSSIIQTYNAAMATSLERIATGLRVNRPSDDIGAYFHSKELNNLAETSAGVASRIQDHLSRLSTAEDAMNSIVDLMDKMSEKAQEASTETNSGIRQSLGEEYDNLRAGIKTIVDTTRYKGQLILNGALDPAAIVGGVNGAGIAVQLGENVTDTFTYQILDSRINPDSSSDATNKYHGMNLASTSAATLWEADKANATLSYNEIAVDDSGLARARRNLGHIATEVTIISGAKTGLENKQANYLAASSALSGVNQAEETSRYASYQIQQQAAASFIAQSNISYGSVISLLSGSFRH